MAKYENDNHVKEREASKARFSLLLSQYLIIIISYCHKKKWSLFVKTTTLWSMLKFGEKISLTMTNAYSKLNKGCAC